MIIYIMTLSESAMLDWEKKKETKRQQCLQKTSDSFYIKLAGRKIANMAITVELEQVKALFNFSYLSPSHNIFACNICKNNYYVLIGLIHLTKDNFWI